MARIAPETRDILVALAEKYSTDDLRVMLSL